MSAVSTLLGTVAGDVVDTFAENWPYLLVGAVTAAVLRTYVGSDRISGFLRGKTWITVIAAVALATFTPFCSCGTEAVVLSLMAGSVPWAPIVAFMVASPLTSPEELVMSGGLFGWTFAITYFIGATVLGLLAGFLTAWIENRGWLAGQARMAFADATSSSPAGSDACCAPTPGLRAALTGYLTAPIDRVRVLLPARGLLARLAAPSPAGADCCAPTALAVVPAAPAASVASSPAGACCGDAAAPANPAVLTGAGVEGGGRVGVGVGGGTNNLLMPLDAASATDSCCSPGSDGTAGTAAPHTDDDGGTLAQRWRLRELGANLWAVSRRILLFFFAFSALGYLLIRVLPSSLFSGFLGGHSAWAVVTMALVGIPLYITTDGSLPLVASLLHSGMSQGAAMAFLITGAGTSLGAIAGALLIARWRVVTLVVAILFVGALIMGYGVQFTLDG